MNFQVCLKQPLSAIALLPAIFALPVHAELIAASDTHYRLSHSATTALSPDALWDRLIHPEQWWNPDHSYSGKAQNLSLDPQAGGLWREDWDGGSVAHGTVVQVIDGKLLRLEAPFGPLQGVGAYVIWTIQIEAADSGSRVTFTEVASAPPGSALQKLAPAVDQVKAEAMERFASH